MSKDELFLLHSISKTMNLLALMKIAPSGISCPNHLTLQAEIGAAEQNIS